MSDSLPAIRFDHESVRVFAPAKRPTVYRVLTPDGLLYAGASLVPRARLHSHLREGPVHDWMLANYGVPLIVEFEFFRNPTAMRKAEEALLEENPGWLNTERSKLNVAWMTRPVKGRVRR